MHYPQMCMVCDLFCLYDLDVDPVTLIYEFDPDILKVYQYLRTKNEVVLVKAFKEETEQERDRHTVALSLVSAGNDYITFVS